MPPFFSAILDWASIFMPDILKISKCIFGLDLNNTVLSLVAFALPFALSFALLAATFFLKAAVRDVAKREKLLETLFFTVLIILVSLHPNVSAAAFDVFFCQQVPPPPL